MTLTTNDRIDRPVGVSLGILLIAVFVFLTAGETFSLGPLDLDTADRLALGRWVAAPIAGGLVAHGLASRPLVKGALSVGLVVGLTVALSTGSGTGQYICWLDLPPVGAFPLVWRSGGS